MSHHFSAGRLDVSARTGVLLAAHVSGTSLQPNLLSRANRDQALISGVAASTAFGWGTVSHSFLRSIADRLPGATRSTRARVVSGLAVDGAAALAGLTAAAALGPRSGEPAARSLVRLGATSTAASAAAGVAADLLELTVIGRGGRAAGLAAAVASWGASYALTRTGQARAGSAPADGGAAEEDITRVVSVPRAAAMGPVVALALMGVAQAESALSALAARGAATVLGGTENDRRTAGRVLAAGALVGLGWAGLSWATGRLTHAGEKLERAHADPPTRPEVTGGPGSLIPWAAQSRESRRWLSMVLRSEDIAHVMGEPARQPIRVYASSESAASAAERAALLLAEIDRTRALERPVFALFSPTGSGYVNYVATETLEYLTRGNCASAAVQYSVLPSALSLGKVHEATAQTRTVLNGIVHRLLAIPPERRPKFYLFGESLGSQVSQELFEGQGLTGPTGIGLDAALWIGTPAATVWRDQITADTDITQAPTVQPGGVYVTRCLSDWTDLAENDRAAVRFLLLQNGDDPIPKFGAPLIWRRPDWLGPDDTRPSGAPRGTRWLPVTTFFATFIDMQNALAPTPGQFGEGGHDYRQVIPDAVRTVFSLTAAPQQMARVQQALRSRELGWETKRRWEATASLPAAEQSQARAALDSTVSGWVGHPVDDARVEAIIEADTGERP